MQRTTAILAFILALISLAHADDGDDTLRRWLASADLVVRGQILAEPIGIIHETGVPNYICEFKVTEVMKGDAGLAGKVINVNIVRFELDAKDKHPLIAKNAESILFLRDAGNATPAWQTVDVWFGVQHPFPWLARSLRRLVAEMKDRTSAFVIQNRKRDDRITAGAEGKRVVLAVTSPSGIGGTEIARKEPTWPAELALRLHLTGLESLTIANGKTTLKVSVLSHGKFDRQLYLLTDYKEGPTLDKASPFWTEVRAFNADGQLTDKLPAKGGWFELTVPSALLGADVQKLEINWIDFYR